MYKKPNIFIINKEDMTYIKAMARSTGLVGCFASGECAGNIDRAGMCNSTTHDNHGTQ